MPTLYETIHQRYGNAAAFVERVNRSLASRKIPKSELAAYAGVDPREIYRWLNGTRTPRLENMLLMDEALEKLLEDHDQREFDL